MFDAYFKHIDKTHAQGSSPTAVRIRSASTRKAPTDCNFHVIAEQRRQNEHLKQVKSSTSRILAFYRGSKQRKSYQNLRAKLIYIQRFWRHYQQHQSLRKFVRTYISSRHKLIAYLKSSRLFASCILKFRHWLLRKQIREAGEKCEHTFKDHREELLHQFACKIQKAWQNNAYKFAITKHLKAAAAIARSYKSYKIRKKREKKLIESMRRNCKCCLPVNVLRCP